MLGRWVIISLDARQVSYHCTGCSTGELTLHGRLDLWVIITLDAWHVSRRCTGCSTGESSLPIGFFKLYTQLPIKRFLLTCIDQCTIVLYDNQQYQLIQPAVLVWVGTVGCLSWYCWWFELVLLVVWVGTVSCMSWYCWLYELALLVLWVGTVGGLSWYC